MLTIARKTANDNHNKVLCKWDIYCSAWSKEQWYFFVCYTIIVIIIIINNDNNDNTIKDY